MEPVHSEGTTKEPRVSSRYLNATLANMQDLSRSHRLTSTIDCMHFLQLILLTSAVHSTVIILLPLLQHNLLKILINKN